MRSLMLTALLFAGIPARALANAACANVDVIGIVPAEGMDSEVYVVVKNEGGYGDGIATNITVKVSYLNGFGTVVPGPSLSVYSLMPQATSRLMAFVPSYAKSVSARVVCSEYGY